MKELTQEQIDRYNREIAIFMGWISSKSEPAGVIFPSIEYWKNPVNGYVGYSHPTYFDWGSLMNIYEKLCEVLPFNFIDIQRDKVYANGYVDLPFQQAVFYVVGETCEGYNNHEFPIKYKNESDIKADS